MATIKFSEFPQGNINAGTAQVVGLEGSNNVRFTPADLVNGLATITYVDAKEAGLQSQITQNTNDITVLQGNIVAIENELANIADTDAQTLSWDGATANLSISNGNNVILQEVLDNAGNIASAQLDITNLITNQNSIALSVSNNSSNITIIQGQIADLQANGNIQTLSLDNSSNVLSISGGNSVDFTTVLANVVGADAQTLTYDSANSSLSISGGNTVSLPPNQTLTWDQANSNLSISGGNTVTINVGGGSGNYGDANVATYLNGNLNTSIVPDTNATYDIGTAEKKIRHLYLSQNSLYFVDSSNVEYPLGVTNGILTFNGEQVTGGNTSYSNATVTEYAESGWEGNIIPKANVTYNLGSPTNAWKDLYLSNSTIYLGDQTISVNNEGTMEFSGNISAQNIIDETSLIIHGGIINTTQAGTTDGLEWEAIDLPGGSFAVITTKMATNGSGILAAGNGSMVTFSKDGGETWQVLNPRTDLGFASSLSNIRIHYISAIDTFFIAGNQGYYFTTQDFVTFSGLLRANPNGWSGLQDIADNGTTLVVISAARAVHYIPTANLSNQAGWNAVINNLWTGGGQITYNGTRFVIIEAATSGTQLQSSTDGITWVNKVASGVSGQRGIAHDETGKIVVVGGNNTFAVSTDDGVTWTTTDITSQVEWPATTALSGVAYGDGLWVVSGYAKGNGEGDIQYVSEDLITWTKIETNIIGQRDISYMSYTGDAFYGQNQDGNYKLDWPVGKQLLLFNSNVVATRSDISYAVSSAKVSSQQHLSTSWLTITPTHDGSNANADISNVSHSEIVFNSADTSLDITSNAQPVAKITSGVLVQVHGSWDASSAGSFSWANDEIASHGINTVTRDAAGIYTVEFETPFATNAYTVTTGVGSTDYSGTGASPRQVSVLTRNAGNCTVICERTDDAVNEDNFYMSLMVCGIVATQ